MFHETASLAGWRELDFSYPLHYGRKPFDLSGPAPMPEDRSSDSAAPGYLETKAWEIVTALEVVQHLDQRMESAITWGVRHPVELVWVRELTFIIDTFLSSNIGTLLRLVSPNLTHLHILAPLRSQDLTAVSAIILSLRRMGRSFPCMTNFVYQDCHVDDNFFRMPRMEAVIDFLAMMPNLVRFEMNGLNFSYTQHQDWTTLSESGRRNQSQILRPGSLPYLENLRIGSEWTWYHMGTSTPMILLASPNLRQLSISHSPASYRLRSDHWGLYGTGQESGYPILNDLKCLIQLQMCELCALLYDRYLQENPPSETPLPSLKRLIVDVYTGEREIAPWAPVVLTSPCIPRLPHLKTVILSMNNLQRAEMPEDLITPPRSYLKTQEDANMYQALPNLDRIVFIDPAEPVEGGNEEERLEILIKVVEEAHPSTWAERNIRGSYITNIRHPLHTHELYHLRTLTWPDLLKPEPVWSDETYYIDGPVPLEVLQEMARLEDVTGFWGRGLQVGDRAWEHLMEWNRTIRAGGWSWFEGDTTIFH
ncbi:hypothetical protein TREMEDRAFT_59587 [Tremella mesenterica DSM 1558]|uniref:uncharacterized protein n=1 Tax=Tremella mesenterica (strain ATCC 24925 / CBS 8224 / DSM 1558 / NBRC 9311 / NRRL Y-6157 / RJB 2259-6 / UBC 559-6) TaxID=578456 RepID=UPI0003F493A1|nr:uncharacterized protein TREMEDRAFT_59587 [Tremella mesenterica DSM 1558]EIW73423.1 hypothetical protein TREMEDRAFT_59587 [Tremella mesenterica DSM 1558]